MPKDCEVIERPELEIPYFGKVFSSSGHIRNFVCDDGDLSPPLLKVVVTVTTTFSNWNLKFFVFFLANKSVPWPKICGKCDNGRGSAPDPAGGGHNAPPAP